MIRFLRGVVIAGLLAAPVAAAEPYNLTKSDMAEIEQSVRRKLKDPESARFRAFTARKTEYGAIVCGFVNAKNSYGGYTGFAPFSGYFMKEQTSMSGRTSLSVVTIGDTSDTLFVVRLNCPENDL